MAKKIKQMKNTTKGGIAIGSAIAAGAAAAYYFYGSKNAKKNRDRAKKWIGNAEKEVTKGVAVLKASGLNKEAYSKVVSAVAKRYQAMENLSAEEVANFIKSLESGWQAIKKSAEDLPAKVPIKRVRNFKKKAS